MKKITEWIENLDLIIPVMIVSVYHYYQALILHDPFLVAVPIAIFVDLLHYRTVKQAVRAQGVIWWIFGLFWTVLAFGLQYTFYNEGSFEFSAKSTLYASLIPAGVFIWSIVSEKQLEPMLNRIEGKLNAAESRLNKVRASLNRSATSLNISEPNLSTADDYLNAIQSHVNGLQSRLNGKAQELNTAELKIAELERLINKYEPAYNQVELMKKKMNPLAQDVLSLVIGTSEQTQADTAKIHAVSTGKVSGLVRSLNGAG